MGVKLRDSIALPEKKRTLPDMPKLAE
jgi:hypothetical protein